MFFCRRKSIAFFIFTGSRQYLGYPAVRRHVKDTVKKAIMITDPGDRLRGEGIVVSWDLYVEEGRVSRAVYLQIWRPIKPDAKRAEYNLVGQTLFYSDIIGHSHIILHPKDRLQVKKGDTIGIYYSFYNPIPWSTVECFRGNKHVFRYNPRRVEPGYTFVFLRSNIDWNPCRHYSVNATIVTREGNVFIMIVKGD